MHICTHKCTHIHIHIMHTNAHTYVHTHITHVYMHTNTHTSFTHKYTHMHVHPRMCTHTYMHIFTQMHTLIHTHAHKCRHMCTHTNAHTCMHNTHICTHTSQTHSQFSEGMMLSIWFHVESSKNHTSPRVCGEIFWKDKLRLGLSAKWYPLAVTVQRWADLRGRQWCFDYRKCLLCCCHDFHLLLTLEPNFFNLPMTMKDQYCSRSPQGLSEPGWEGGSIQPPGVRTDFSALPESTDTHCWTTQHAPCKTL